MAPDAIDRGWDDGTVEYLRHTASSVGFVWGMICLSGKQQVRSIYHLGTYVEGEGRALFDLTKQKGMEGIIAKREKSTYRPGKRSFDLLKIKPRLQQEFVVGGFTGLKRTVCGTNGVLSAKGGPLANISPTCQ